MSKATPPTLLTTNWRSYDAALKQRGSLLIWFDPETVWLAEPGGKRGRSATFADAAIQACLTLRALFGLPLRQTTGLVASLLELAGLDWPVPDWPMPDWPVPDFSTLCRRQKGLCVAIPYRQSTGALHLLIDSTGIKAEGEGEWFAKKRGPSKPRQWRKVHLGIDADTLEIRAIEITGSRVGDAPMLPGLSDQIRDDQPIAKVSADGAYDTRGCHAAIATPQLPRRNCRAQCLRRHTCPQERAPVAGKHPRRSGQERNRPRHPPLGPHDLEALERVSPTKPGRNQNAMLQAPRGTRHGARLRQAGGRATDQRSNPEPLHGTWNTANSARGGPCPTDGETRLQADLCNRAIAKRQQFKTPWASLVQKIREPSHKFSGRSKNI